MVYQQDAMDCGPSCLVMISSLYSKKVTLSFARDLCNISREGVSFLNIAEAGMKLGFDVKGVKISLDFLIESVNFPCVIHWNENHFVVVYKVNKSKIYLLDPAIGKVSYTIEEFSDKWTTDASGDGFALLFKCSENFTTSEEIKSTNKTRSFYKYLKPHKFLLFQIATGMIFGSILQLVLPFLTQAMVDFGVIGKDHNVLQIILIGQLFFTLGAIVVSFFQGWIILYIGSHININMLCDFFMKIIKLPINFFETRQSGDVLQRISDQSRIENFISNILLQILLTIANLIIFSAVLLYYNHTIFLIFFLGSLANLIWISFFLKKRKKIDYEQFSFSSKSQDILIQLVKGVQEIKLNNCETKKISQWLTIKKKLYNISVSSLKLSQYQTIGSSILNEFLHIFILFISANFVINSELTFGMMISIQFIIGQVNAPLNEIISYIYIIQDTKISMERLSYVQNHENEMEENKNYIPVPELKEDIVFKNVSFRYGGGLSPIILDDISFSIPSKKKTAIVGMSGCGKTTIIKLLLGLYKPTSGSILINNADIQDINLEDWRDLCGTVMQDGYIFSDTIYDNICLNDKKFEEEEVSTAAEIANIGDFISELPLKYKTMVGSNGIGLSTGQKQRILIARAICKNPEVIIFDEATNSLDANNELIILDKMDSYLRDKTSIIIAHRLSTVKDADQIIVLKKGRVEEIGRHNDLIDRKGEYYNLVNNQLYR